MEQEPHCCGTEPAAETAYALFCNIRLYAVLQLLSRNKLFHYKGSMSQPNAMTPIVITN